MPARARWTLPLAALALAAAARADGPRARPHPPPEAALNYPDGGTIRAQGIIVPPTLKLERVPEEPPGPQPLITLAAPDVLAVLGEFQPRLGAWTEYSVTEHGRQTTRFLVSLLPPPMPDGHFWVEIDTIDTQTLPVAMRILAHGDPMQLANIDRAIIQVPGQAPFEVPFSALPTPAHPAGPASPSGAKITSTRHVRIKVKAGTFTADRIHLVRGKEAYTVWRSSEVPLFGLVRSEGGGRVTELAAMGTTGAHSLFSAPIQDENVPPPPRAPAAAAAQGNGSDSK